MRGTSTTIRKWLSRRNGTTMKPDSLVLDFVQIDAVLRFSVLSKGAGGIENSLAPINKLPAETFVFIATFFTKERDRSSSMFDGDGRSCCPFSDWCDTGGP